VATITASTSRRSRTARWSARPSTPGTT
jgi:hypothetical protein